MSGFDRVARIYHALELAAFGRTLQRARTAFLDRITAGSRVLILGDGDGRFLRALLDTVPGCTVHCVDGSARMLSLAAARLTAEERTRATFEHADARQYDPGPRPFDAIVTLFFLDCFVEHDVRQLVSRLSPNLREGGIWLFADFAIPARAPARWHAQLVVNGLYLFFRWRAGLDARALPPSEAILQTAGLVAADQREYRAGLIRSVVYLRA